MLRRNRPTARPRRPPQAALAAAFALLAADVLPFEAELVPLFEASCLACHSNTALSPLDLTATSSNLDDPATFRVWERLHDRVERGEMPPPPLPKPDAALTAPALEALAAALTEASRKARGAQRTPLRRLTRLEYQHTIADLLHIAPAEAARLAQTLPGEADSGGFDTVAANQGFSALHVRAYMDAADAALDLALAAGPRPEPIRFRVEYAQSPYLNFMHEAKFLGGGVTKKLDDAVATFFDTASTYMFHTGTEGFTVPTPGRYRVSVAAYPYQAKSPVTLTLFKGTQGVATAALTDLIGVFDLVGSEAQVLEVETYLRPGDVVSPSVADLRPPPGHFVNYFLPDKNVKNYRGEGIAIQWLEVKGPLGSPQRGPLASENTHSVFGDLAPDLRGAGEADMLATVANFATLAFRRPLAAGEAEAYAAMARPALAAGEPLRDVLRVPLRAILAAPSFLFHAPLTGGRELDEYALATRLAYFLWRSMPDAALFAQAAAGRLSTPGVLAAEVERMLAHPKSERFVKDFAGQAFRLREIHATTPDAGLYPEYDERLGQAMVAETELFLQELFAEDLSVRHLLDADFTFLNRRLAEHYGIPGVRGQQMRRTALPAGSVRGGLLAQASILKITANGTTTSPVPRGNFVLANLLGQPAPPPPPNVAGLEPDTRGATTIREQLAAHRANAVCASCHASIDPPGLALESFDPIGGFRKRYRASGNTVVYEGVEYPGRFKPGPPVDASGVTPEGLAFAGFAEYQRHLLEHKVRHVARHMVSQLLVLATGAEIEFADRAQVERIVARLEPRDYPMRTMLHEVAKSPLFRAR